MTIDSGRDKDQAGLSPSRLQNCDRSTDRSLAIGDKLCLSLQQSCPGLGSKQRFGNEVVFQHRMAIRLGDDGIANLY